MSRLAVLGALATLLAAPGPATAGDTPAPALLRAIAALDPSAVPVDRTDIASDDCAIQAAHPARVAGDFDGDGRQDWALYLRSPRPVGTEVVAGRPWAMHAVRFVVFLARPGDRFDPVTIRRWASPLPIGSMLERRAPGPVREVGDAEGREVVLAHPGIVEIYCGKAASTYYWDPRRRRFESVVTAD